MTRISLTILAAAAIMAAALGSGCQKTVSTDLTSTKTAVDRPESPINADAFLDIARFHASFSTTSTKIDGSPVAGVVNHHALASDLLTGFFRTLSKSRPDIRRIIILSPDHYKRGTDAISVGSFDYTTQGKLVRVDQEAVSALAEAGAGRGSRDLFVHEHGVAALVPFLAREFDSVVIVPITIRVDIGRERASEFGETLRSLIDEHTFVVISADMSHYLREDVALKNDVSTEDWLRRFDADAIGKANDDFTDNGPSFVTLFRLLEKMNVKPTFQKLDHSISSRYGGDKLYTTSYITGIWTK
ncbi:MAG: AmmeMemoRadiSam system protein B [Patescibacteria group bacterium]|jgi:poly-gamma-glutamate synthesis protein (capsule biosynthesis protein)